MSLLWVSVFWGAAPSQSPTPQNKPVSVLVLDFAGDGFQLTDAAHGVMFDIEGTGTPVRIGWLLASGDDAFIVVNWRRGEVLSGRDLLGNGIRLPDGNRVSDAGRALLAIQGTPMDAQGRLLGPVPKSAALTPEDSVFSELRIWRDRNHNGRAEPVELSSLHEAGLLRIPSLFQNARTVDAFGNILGTRGSFLVDSRGIGEMREMAAVQFVR